MIRRSKCRTEDFFSERKRVFYPYYALRFAKPDGLNRERLCFVSRKQAEWHSGTKRQRQEFWTEVVHSACNSLLKDDATKADGEFRGHLRRLTRENNVPRKRCAHCDAESLMYPERMNVGSSNPEHIPPAECIWLPTTHMTLFCVYASITSGFRAKFDNYMAVTLGLEGERRDKVAARLWDAVESRLKLEAGPGVDCLLTRVKSR